MPMVHAVDQAGERSLRHALEHLPGGHPRSAAAATRAAATGMENIEMRTQLDAAARAMPREPQAGHAQQSAPAGRTVTGIEVMMSRCAQSWLEMLQVEPLPRDQCWTASSALARASPTLSSASHASDSMRVPVVAAK